MSSVEMLYGALQVNKCHVKVQYDKSVRPMKFSEGDLVLLWDQSNEALGQENLTPCGMVLTLLNVC